jgi:flagellar P-ring protein precursor FlgI
VVAGGGATVGPASVSHGGLTLLVGGQPATSETANGIVRVEPQTSVQEVSAGLHAAGAKPEEIAAIFEALQAAGAIHAQVVVR